MGRVDNELGRAIWVQKHQLFQSTVAISGGARIFSEPGQNFNHKFLRDKIYIINSHVT
jgi:hypothetical protein